MFALKLVLSDLIYTSILLVFALSFILTIFRYLYLTCISY